MNHHRTVASHCVFYARPRYWTQPPRLHTEGNRETHEVAQHTSILCEHGPALLPLTSTRCPSYASTFDSAIGN
jgi:hypothetical protein